MLRIWNESGGCINWPALDLLAEIHGCSDPETLVAELLAIRAFVETKD